MISIKSVLVFVSTIVIPPLRPEFFYLAQEAATFLLLEVDCARGSLALALTHTVYGGV